MALFRSCKYGFPVVFFFFFFFSCFVIFPFVVHFSFLFLACVASVSARVRRKSWDESKKIIIIKGEGGGEEEGNGCPQTHDFEKLRSLTNAASDWCGAGSVDYLALETSINRSIFNLQSVRKAKSKNNK